MKLFNWINTKTKNMRWQDISILKLTMFFATLFILTIWPALQQTLLAIHWGWYLTLTLGLSLLLISRLLK